MTVTRLLVLCTVFATFALPSSAAAEGLIVAYEPGADRAEVRADVAARDAETLPNPRGRTELLEVPDAEAAARDLRGEDGVRYAEPDLQLELAAADPLLGRQWGLPAVRAADAWPLSSGAGVTVGVVDTGVPVAHEDLRVAEAVTLVDEPAGDSDGHGTHVAGIIGAQRDNGVGIAGLAPGVTLLSADVFVGRAPSSTFVEGFLAMADRGARIVNASLGHRGRSSYVADVVRSRPGTLLVAAAGNDGEDITGPGHTPCADDAPNIVCVGAHTSTGARTSFSNYGEGVDLYAPGDAILSTLPGGYGEKRGTSMATPFVTAAAALVLARDPQMTTDELRAAVIAGTTNGRLDARKALDLQPTAPGVSDVRVAPDGAGAVRVTADLRGRMSAQDVYAVVRDSVGRGGQALLGTPPPRTLVPDAAATVTGLEPGRAHVELRAGQTVLASVPVDVAARAPLVTSPLRVEAVSATAARATAAVAAGHGTTTWTLRVVDQDGPQVAQRSGDAGDPVDVPLHGLAPGQAYAASLTVTDARGQAVTARAFFHTRPSAPGAPQAEPAGPGALRVRVPFPDGEVPGAKVEVVDDHAKLRTMHDVPAAAGVVVQVVPGHVVRLRALSGSTWSEAGEAVAPGTAPAPRLGTPAVADAAVTVPGSAPAAHARASAGLRCADGTTRTLAVEPSALDPRTSRQLRLVLPQDRAGCRLVVVLRSADGIDERALVFPGAPAADPQPVSDVPADVPVERLTATPGRFAPSAAAASVARLRSVRLARVGRDRVAVLLTTSGARASRVLGARNGTLAVPRGAKRLRVRVVLTDGRGRTTTVARVVRVPPRAQRFET